PRASTTTPRGFGRTSWSHGRSGCPADARLAARPSRLLLHHLADHAPQPGHDLLPLLRLPFGDQLGEVRAAGIGKAAKRLAAVVGDLAARATAVAARPLQHQTALPQLSGRRRESARIDAAA